MVLIFMFKPLNYFCPITVAAEDEPLADAASEKKDEKRDLSLIDKIRIENNKQRALQLRKQRQEEKEEM